MSSDIGVSPARSTVQSLSMRCESRNFWRRDAPAAVADAKGRGVKGDRLERVAVAVVALLRRAVLVAVVAVADVLEKVHLHPQL